MQIGVALPQMADDYGPQAEAMAAEVSVADPDVVRRVVDDAEAAGCDEVVAVPATADPRALDALADHVSER